MMNHVNQYIIRMVDDIKTTVKEKQDEAARTGADFDAIAEGVSAAESALAKYGFGFEPEHREAVEGSVAGVVEPGVAELERAAALEYPAAAI